MVIYGNYDATRSRVPSPYVEGYVSFTRLGVQGYVEFLIDSGANGVVLRRADARKLGITEDQLKEAGSLVELVGLGGAQKYYSVAGLLVFEVEQPPSIRCQLDIHIAGGESTTPESVPSLLGRDFLNMCYVRLNYSTGLVALEPINVNEHGEMSCP